MMAAQTSTTTTRSSRAASGNSLFPMPSPPGTHVALSSECRPQRRATEAGRRQR